MKYEKEREPKYIPSPLNNNMINYKEYYMSMNEKIGYSLLIFIIGGLVGLVFMVVYLNQMVMRH